MRENWKACCQSVFFCLDSGSRACLEVNGTHRELQIARSPLAAVPEGGTASEREIVYFPQFLSV